MNPRTRPLVLLVGLAALAAGCGQSSNISKEAVREMNPRMESMPDANANNPVHTIVLPHDEPVFPPGTGRDEFVTACVVCHSPRYITMQPRFPRATWLSEVKKMRDTYGAHITDEQAVRIADYLFSINGKAGNGKAPKGTYGE
jgi:sulfite dehydrogenase (cytochrome) subunit B